MKVAVMIEAQEGLTWEHWFRIADRVEELGLDSLWRSDHFFSLSGDLRRPALECWTSLTALAQRTRRIRFGPLVSPMTFRHPALLARMAAAVDLLSGGRLVLGVGAGWNVAEHEAFGIGLPPLKERFDRFEEGIAVIKALWTGRPVDLEERYYPLRGAAAYPRPQQQPAPPLLIGGDGEVRLLRIVAREADEWNSHAPTPEGYRVKRAKLEEHCRAVGRDPSTIRRSWLGGAVGDGVGVGGWLGDGVEAGVGVELVVGGGAGPVAGSCRCVMVPIVGRSACGGGPLSGGAFSRPYARTPVTTRASAPGIKA